MAPITLYSSMNTRRDSDDHNNHKPSNENDNDDNDKSKNTNIGSGSSHKSLPVKVITQQLTTTVTTVQTSLVFVPFAGFPNTATPGVQSSNSFTPVSTARPTVPLPMPSGTLTSSDPSSESIQTVPMQPGKINSLSLSTVASIILGSLFLITLCLVIYVRSPKFLNRLMQALRKNYRRPPPPTISSFEAKEYKSYASSDVARPSFPTYLYPSAVQCMSPTETLTATFSSSRAGSRNIPTLSAMGYGPNSRVSDTDSHRTLSSPTPVGYKTQDTLKVTNGDSERVSTTSSVFDQYPFENDGSDSAKRLSQILAEWQANIRASRTSHSFPQSVHEMTAE